MVNQQERILIVDDEPAIRRLLCRKLSREGYQCEEADGAEQVLAKLRQSPTELVILDAKMPGNSGIELLPGIMASYPDTAVIVATGVNETKAAIQCMKHGADDYVCKPFNLSEVVLSVERTLEKRELQLKIKDYQQRLEHRVDAKTTEIRQLFLGTIEALVFNLEAKDRYTTGHSRRVTETATGIGRELGLSVDDIEDLRWGSLLHDVGKIAVNQLIQNKPGKLTRTEYAHVMIHANVGAGIVKPVANEQVVATIAHHHDHYDGSGLYQTVAGKDIPLGARILALADSFDAMTSERPYRPAMSAEEALGEIKRCAATQFDPAVVEAFLRTTHLR